MGLVPFSILREEIVSSNRAKRWWRPTWPGLLPIVSVATLWTAVQIGGWLVSLIPTETGLGIKIPIWVLGLAVALIYPLAQAVVLIYRMNLRALTREAWSRVRPAIRPNIAVGTRLFALMLMFATPYIFWSYSSELAMVVPQWHEEQGTTMPSVVLGVMSLGFWYDRYASIIGLYLPWGVLATFLTGRLVWLAGAGREAALAEEVLAESLRRAEDGGRASGRSPADRDPTESGVWGR
jgi:hypothetical protein